MTDDRAFPVSRPPRRPVAGNGGARGAAVPSVVLVELDGVLVDTPYLHATAWSTALFEGGVPQATARIHRLCGLDAKELLVALLGRFDEAIARRHDELFAASHAGAHAHAGADAFLEGMLAAHVPVIVVSPEPPGELPPWLAALDTTTSISEVVALPAPVVRHEADPHPGAPRRGTIAPADALAVTATLQGAADASAHGVRCVGLETGGLSRQELLGAGAAEVYRDLRELLARWQEHVAVGVPFGEPDATVEVVVEIPARTRNKYELDEPTGRLRLDRQLPASLAYPADYGFLPGTCAEDGDALDAVVLLDEPVVPGTVVCATPLGLIWVEDEAGKDPKLVTVLADRARAEQLTELDDLPAWRLAELEHFFAVYKQLEHGRSSRSCGFGSRADAWREVAAARRRATIGQVEVARSH